MSKIYLEESKKGKETIDKFKLKYLSDTLGHLNRQEALLIAGGSLVLLGFFLQLLGTIFN